MAAVVFIALAALVGIGAAALAWTQARRAAAATGEDLAPLTLALKRVHVEERLGELLRRSTPGSWVHELATEALAAPNGSARVAVVNLAISDAEHALSRGAGWPGAALRIALLGAGLLTFAAYLYGDGELKAPLAVVGIGVVAAFTCVEAGRSARRNAERQRRAIDELVATAMGESPTPVEPPGTYRASPPVRRRRRDL